MITFKHKGNFNKTDSFLNRVGVEIVLRVFEKYGREGVSALASATPLDSGETRNAWNYEISRTSKAITITWINDHVEKGIPIAIIIQYGHATRGGGYVQGRDYINPAIRPVFDKIQQEIWREVTAL